MAERWVEYKSNGGRTRTYKVLGSFVDTIMYGPRRGQRVPCLRLEKPWEPGRSFSVVASRCKDVPSPRPAYEPQPGEEWSEHGPTYAYLGGEDTDGEPVYDAGQRDANLFRGRVRDNIPF